MKRAVKSAVLVTGDRNWTDVAAIERELSALPKGTLVVQGGASGADSIAKDAADRLSLPSATVPYFKWLGRAGGPARNGVMRDLILGLQAIGYEVSVLAFHACIEQSKGTADMVRISERAGVLVTVVGS